jgi:DNA invertase Pin-like site-specific DNA recombinase
LINIKEEIVALLKDGVPKKKVAKGYGTSIVNLYNWILKKRYRTTIKNDEKIIIDDHEKRSLRVSIG